MNLNNRPYLETKVVKVKKGKKEWTPDYCPCCGQTWDTKPKPKDNWINGKNLDKIKFPCFCRYTHNQNGKKYLGMISKGMGEEVDKYEIIRVDKQVRGGEFFDGEMFSEIFSSDTLKELMECHNVHILKGKIILFEDDTEDEYSDE